MKNFNFDLNDFFRHFGEELKTIFDEHDELENSNDDFKSKEKKTFKKWEDGELIKDVEEEWENGKRVKFDDKLHNKKITGNSKKRNIPITSDKECCCKDRDLEALTKKYDKLLNDYDELEKDYYDIQEANKRLLEEKMFLTDELSKIHNEVKLCGETWLKIQEACDHYNKNINKF